MYCPQCGTESSSGQQYCRTCGANLKFIGKAVGLSEAIARSDRGPLPRVKQMVQEMKAELTQGPRAEMMSEEVSGALDRLNKEIVSSFQEGVHVQALRRKPAEPPEVRRERHVVKGASELFGGIGLMIFLYYFSAAIVLKVPPEQLAKIPFELEPVVRMIWLFGLVPALSGLGRLTAGLLIGTGRAEPAALPGPPPPPPQQPQPPQFAAPRTEATREFAPPSVTESTTELLDERAPGAGRETAS
jgi:hypothetical protein